MFERMATIIPPGESGTVKIEHVTITAADAALDNMRAFGRYSPVTPGTMCRLLVSGSLMMSDGPNEHHTNSEIVHKSHGDVLIAGLGIGMVLLPILKKSEVRTVTVIEKYPDVDALVTPHIRKAAGTDAEKLSVGIADIFAWSPYKGSKYDIIYFDIWPSVCVDDLDQMTALKRKYAKNLRRTNPNSWMGCWYENKLRAKKSHHKRGSFATTKERLRRELLCP